MLVSGRVDTKNWSYLFKQFPFQKPIILDIILGLFGDPDLDLQTKRYWVGSISTYIYIYIHINIYIYTYTVQYSIHNVYLNISRHKEISIYIYIIRCGSTFPSEPRFFTVWVNHRRGSNFKSRCAIPSEWQ